MFILAMILSVFIGMTMAMLGGGGSILTVPILVYVLGVETKSAIATSLLVVIAIGAFSTFMHARAGNVQWTTGFVFGLVAMVGAYGGGLLGAYISGSVLLILFTGMMIVTALAMLRPGKKGPQPDGVRHAPLLRYTLIILEGLAVGLATGLVGAGGGFLVVPVLVLLVGLSMHRAVGTALLIIVMKSAASFAGYLSHETIDYRLAGYVIVMALAGAAVGSVLAHRLAHAFLRKAFAWFVLVMAVFILYRELTLEMLQPIFETPWEYWAVGVALIGIAIVGIGFFRAPALTRRTLPFAPGEEKQDRAEPN